MNHIITKKLTGFNLVELMIVLSILALITTLAITNYISYSKKAAVTSASTLADNIKSRVMLYYTDQEQFPSLANGNATEIKNSFNVSVLDANTKKYVSNTEFYSFSDASTPLLPPSITSQLSISATILGYIKIDLNPAQHLSTDPAVTAQIFLVASEISNSVSLNALPEKAVSMSYDTPHLVLTASNPQIGTQITWTTFSVGIAHQFIPQGATPACSGNQILQSGNCAPCAAGSYASINPEGINICAPCELGTSSATAGAALCTPCNVGTYTPAVGSTSCTNCGTGIATCDPTNGAAITCISSTATTSYSLIGPSGVAGTTCNATCSGATFKLNNACQACPSNCTACTSTVCSSCIIGYYGSNCSSSTSSCTGVMFGSGVTATCTTCPSQAICSSGAITGCQPGYYGPNCSSSISSCAGIMSGSGVTATCTACPTHAICSGGTITGCQFGYYDPNCSSSISSCAGIMSGSGVTATCTACPIHAICSGGTITGCQTGYYDMNCSSSTSSCAGVMSGSGVTATCNACPTHAICSGGAITGCQTGYSGNNCANYCTGYLTGSGVSATCNNCPPNATCSNGAITGCQSGYSGSGGNCTSCTSAIITGCSSSTGGATSCNAGYQLSGTSGAAGTTCIVSCPYRATSCSADGGAIACSAGFELVGPSGAAGTTCKVPCPSNSVRVNSPGAPAVSDSPYNYIQYYDGPNGSLSIDCVCLPGLYPGSGNGGCSCNVANCQACQYNANICQTCNTGYTPSANGGQCILCNIARCGACSSANVCDYCIKPGYPYPIRPTNNQCPP